MKKNLTLICAAALVFAACTKTTAPEAPESGLQPYTLSAGFSEMESRTYAGTSPGNAVATVIWTSDDELSVFDSAGNNNEFAMDPDDKGNAAADFTGSIAAGSTAQYAMFPYESGATIDGDIITATVKTSQSSSNATSFGKSANLAIGKVAGSTTELKNTCGLIRFVVPNMHVRSVKISCKEGENLTGKAKFDLSTGVPVLSEVVEGSNSVTFGSSKILYASSFFACVLPGTYHGINVTITMEDGTIKNMGDPESTAPLGVERAKVTDLGILSVVADKVLTLNFFDNSAFTSEIPASSPTENGTTNYTDAEGNTYVLGITDYDGGGKYFYSDGKGLVFMKTGKAYLEAPTITGKHLCAFGASHANSNGTGTRNLWLYTTAAKRLGGDFAVSGYAVAPNFTYYTTGIGLSSSKKLPDQTIRISSGNSNNVVIYQLKLYYAND